VSMVDKVVDPASNTFRVHLELPNPNGAMPAGLRCKAQFGTSVVPVAPVAPVTSAGVAAAKAP
jgi:membrane fusion protein, heavy metal efflux system